MAAGLLALWTVVDLGIGAGDAKLLALLFTAVTVPVAVVLLAAPTGVLLAARLIRTTVLRGRNHPQSYPLAPYLAGVWFALCAAALLAPRIVRLP